MVDTDGFAWAKDNWLVYMEPYRSPDCTDTSFFPFPENV